MERARKSSRNAPNGEQNVDRVSALPDGVICHILTFLETQESVQTSILAKRWRFLWAHVPVLHFKCEYGASFLSIINTVMLRHKIQSLSTFGLTYTGAYADRSKILACYELETCIATLVERSVKNLHLEQLRVYVPLCLLTCKTLVDLTLKGVIIPSTAPIYLPNIKKIHLFNIKGDVDFTRLLSGCPVLEELIIDRTTSIDLSGCYISSPTLKRLNIIYLLDHSIFNYPDYMLTINTPSLRYLKVSDLSSKHISISPCTSLVEADISVYYLCGLDDCNHQRVVKFLDSIRNVKYLGISVLCGKIWDGRMPGSIAKFGNLTKLKFSANWRFLSKFLERADHLQVLVFCEDKFHSEHWMGPVEERCDFSLHFLRTVRIDHFRCTEEGFNMVRHILRNARVLERMEINYFCEGIILQKKFDAIRRISLHSRELKKCELDSVEIDWCLVAT